METLNLLQYVPLETGTDQVSRNKGTWHGHSRIPATRAVCRRWRFPDLLFSTEEKWHLNDIKVGTQAIESQEIQKVTASCLLSVRGLKPWEEGEWAEKREGRERMLPLLG